MAEFILQKYPVVGRVRPAEVIQVSQAVGMRGEVLLEKGSQLAPVGDLAYYHVWIVPARSVLFTQEIRINRSHSPFRDRGSGRMEAGEKRISLEVG